MKFEFNTVGCVGVEFFKRNRRTFAADHRYEFGPVRHRFDGRGEGRARPAPGDDLAGKKPDRVAAPEPALRVVSGGGSDAADGDPGTRRTEPVPVDLYIGFRIELDHRQQPFLLGFGRDHLRVLLGKFAGTFGSHDHVRGVRQDEHVLGGDCADACQKLCRRRVHGVAAGNHLGSHLAEQGFDAGAAADYHDAGSVGGQSGLTFGYLFAHVGDVEVGYFSGAIENRHRRFGVVGVDMDLEGRFVADHEHRVAQFLQIVHEIARNQAGAGNDEIGAVLVAAVFVVGPARDAGGLVLDHRQLGIFPAKRGEHAGEDEDEAITTGVDHP